MKNKDDEFLESRVPSGRMSRFLQLSATASKMALGGAAEAARRVATRTKEELPHALLTAQNAAILAKRLARLRGAAMKVGQMLSMEGDNLLPKEFAEALEVLRSSAHRMPRAQVEEVLRHEFGEYWRDQFRSWDPSAFASASIGQVHLAQTLAGEDIILKIQYPGVAESIDSDVDNLRSLIALTRVLPSDLELDSFVAEVKEELRREVDYDRELEMLIAYRAALGEHSAIAVPRAYPEISSSRVLALEKMPGTALLTWARTASQDERDAAGSLLFELLLKELFVFGLMQTDPNPANYFHDGSRLILLDFGATREVPAETREVYRRAFLGLYHRDRARLIEVLGALNVPVSEHPAITEMLVELSLEAAESFNPGPYDFGESDLTQRIKRHAERIGATKIKLPPPPPAYLFFQRKLGGTFLLLRNLKARVHCREILERTLAL